MLVLRRPRLSVEVQSQPDLGKEMRSLSCPGNHSHALTMSPNLQASRPGCVFSSIYAYPAVEAETEFGLNPESIVESQGGESTQPFFS